MALMKRTPPAHVGRRAADGRRAYGTSAAVGKARPARRTATPRRPTRAGGVDAWLAALCAGLPPLPSLPADFSRADVYGDHD